MSRALVRNHAKLAYRGVGDWLAGRAPLPPAAAAVPGLDALLTLQDQAARALNQRRHEEGALEFDRVEASVGGGSISGRPRRSLHPPGRPPGPCDSGFEQDGDYDPRV